MATMTLTPINAAEAIIAPLWDASLDAIDSYSIATAGDARVWQNWARVEAGWTAAPVGVPVATLARQCDLPLDGYDRLMLRVAMPLGVRMTVTATVDGREQPVIVEAAGTGNAREYEGAVAGLRLQGLSVSFSTTVAQPDEVWLYWIGLAHDARRTLLAQPSPYTPAWDGFLLPEATSVEFAPRFGFFFDADELPAIRRRAHSPLYRPLMEHLRAYARASMAYPTPPEAQVREHIPLSAAFSPVSCRDRDADLRSFHIDAPTVAFVGLIDEDPALLRFAARIAMSTAMCERWCGSFVEHFPGSRWSQRSFMESAASAFLALTLDWAGSWFTGKGEEWIRHCVSTKGLPRVRQDFLEYEYIWRCNQSHMFSLGRVLGLLLQQRAWPRAAADLDVFERDLYEMFDDYIQPDGSTNEGVGYWSNSFSTSLPALAALARYRGKPLAAMIPERLHRMWDYVGALLATAGEPGAYLAISDTVGDQIAWDAIGMLGSVMETGGWRGLLGACLQRRTWYRPALWWNFDGPFTIIFGPDDCPAPQIQVPVFKALETAGMVTSNRPWGDGDVRLHLVGGMANSQHSHPDKGAFILEAAGEAFAADRGMVPYSDTENMALLHRETSHNLAIPAGVVQKNPPPAAALWQAQGDTTMLEAAIDTSALWEAPVRVARRTIHSPQPDLIEIIDEFELDDSRPVSFYLNSPLPIAIEDTTGIIQGQRAVVRVRAAWAVSAEAGPHGCDFGYRPYQRLCLTSAPATSHRLRTVLQVSVAP